MVATAVPIRDTGITKFFLGSLKKRPDMTPIMVLVLGGFALAACTGIRTLLCSPDVVINRSKHPEPWNELRHKQYKLIRTRDYSEPDPAPEF